MKKFFTTTLVSIAFLLSSTGIAKAQTGATILNTNFEDWGLTVNQTPTNLSVPNATITIVGSGYNNSTIPNAGTNSTYPNYIRFGSNVTLTNGIPTNQYLKVTPTAPFVNGGKITIIISQNANATETNSFALQVAGTVYPVNNFGKAHTAKTLELPATVNGIQDVYFYRTSVTAFIHAIKIETNPSTPAISAFKIPVGDDFVDAEIDDTENTITAELPYGTALTAITPDVTLQGTAKSYTPAGVQDFTSTVTYSIFASEDGTGDALKTYAVTLTIAETQNSDATLSDLLIDGTTIAGFDSETTEYNIVLPYSYPGIPVVSAEKNDPAASEPVVNNATSIPGSTSVTVTA
ncbi:MAG: hypothetical protein LBS07_04880, partial [Prevotellaceae bacterium]|nr:hypothetical protein [Prevotellaceae bacterium]